MKSLPILEGRGSKIGILDLPVVSVSYTVKISNFLTRSLDIPAAAYQLSFESNTQWSAYYAPGPEIQRYWEGIAEKYDVYRYITFNTQVTEARWDQEEGLWTIRLRDVITGRVSLCIIGNQKGRT